MPILVLIGGILVVLWLLGFFLFHIGAIIHLILLLAVIAFVWHLVTGGGRRI